MTPTVSVIIPAYNRATLLPRAIDSVLSQSGVDFELLVVDDGSDDDTAALLKGYGSRLTVISQAHQGVSAARNAGIRAARAPLLAFLDSDDWFLKGKLARQSTLMLANPGALVSHTEEKWLRRGKHLNQKKRHRKEGGNIFSRCLELCAVGMSTIMTCRELFSRFGMFDESLPCCEDYDLWLRVSAGEPFLFVNQPLTVKEGGREDQLSARHRLGMDKYRIYALRKLLKSAVLTREQDKLTRRELARKCRIYGNGCLKHGRSAEGREFLEIAAQDLE